MLRIGIPVLCAVMSPLVFGANETVYASIGPDGKVGLIGTFDDVRLVHVSSDKRPDGVFQRLGYYSTGLENLYAESQLSSVLNAGLETFGSVGGGYVQSGQGGYYISTSSFSYYQHDEIVFRSDSSTPVVEFKFSMVPSGVLNQNVNSRVSSSLDIGSASSNGVQNPFGSPDGSIHFDLTWQNGVVSGQVYNTFVSEYYAFHSLPVCAEAVLGACVSASNPFEISYLTSVPEGIELGLNFNMAGSVAVSLVGERDEFGGGGVSAVSKFSVGSVFDLDDFDVESRSGLSYKALPVPEPSGLALIASGGFIVFFAARRRRCSQQL